MVSAVCWFFRWCFEKFELWLLLRKSCKCSLKRFKRFCKVGLKFRLLHSGHVIVVVVCKYLLLLRGVSDVEYIYGFVGWVSAGKVDDVIPSRAVQDGGYASPWQRYDNNKMAAICYSTSSTVQS